MSIATPPLRFDLIVTHCAWCRCYPCRCPRTERCVCGGWLVASEGAEAEAVRWHNATPEHQAWRERLP